MTTMLINISLQVDGTLDSPVSWIQKATEWAIYLYLMYKQVERVFQSPASESKFKLDEGIRSVSNYFN